MKNVDEKESKFKVKCRCEKEKEGEKKFQQTNKQPHDNNKDFLT
jgi:hypothetical protein